jgi:hypothetical protein
MTTTLEKDYTLYRLGYMAGGHPNNVETLSISSPSAAGEYLDSALGRELQPGIAHFVLGAAFASQKSIEEALAGCGSEEVEVEARFVGLETGRLRSIVGGFAIADGRSVPCVVAKFASPSISRHREEIHKALIAAGIPVLELFENGNTYPEGFVYVVLNTCIDDASATKMAFQYADTTALATTVQKTTNWLSLIPPHGSCTGLKYA